jgi:ABC-type nickel/cobalt efflux system permease component RcnA
MLGLLCSLSPLQASPQKISWDDLLPAAETAFDDPFVNLSSDQLSELGMIARIRRLLSEGKCSPDGTNAQEEKRLVAELAEQGLDADWLLSQRERVKQMRRARAENGGDAVVNQHIRLPGFVLPIQINDGRATEFLLLPWMGNCSHSAMPPPNQMVYIKAPDGVQLNDRFSPVVVEGVLQRDPNVYDLFFLDGRKQLEVMFAVESDQVTLCTPEETQRLLADMGSTGNGSWLKRLQMRSSMLFTKTMMDIKERRVSGALWIGIAFAFAYGLLHTLGPGHGKTVVISYFVGNGGSLMRGIKMGIQIAVFHVFSAILVVWTTDFVVRQATGQAPANFRLIRLISYAFIAAIGIYMLINAVRAVRAAKNHEHHEAGCSCMHHQPAKGLGGWLALAVGSVPCTGAVLVLLFGMANGLVGSAILLVVFMSAGMAVAMAGIGVVGILGRNLAQSKVKMNEASQLRFAQSVRIVSALAILTIGLLLFSFTIVQA